MENVRIRDQYRTKMRTEVLQRLAVALGYDPDERVRRLTTRAHRLKLKKREVNDVVRQAKELADTDYQDLERFLANAIKGFGKQYTPGWIRDLRTRRRPTDNMSDAALAHLRECHFPQGSYHRDQELYGDLEILTADGDEILRSWRQKLVADAKAKRRKTPARRKASPRGRIR